MSQNVYNFDNSYFKVDIFKETIIRMIIANPLSAFYLIFLNLFNKERFYVYVIKTINERYLESAPLNEKFKNYASTAYREKLTLSSKHHELYNKYISQNLQIKFIAPHADDLVINKEKLTVWDEIKCLFDQCRVYQWVKNTLIFVPLITALSFNNLDLLNSTAITAILFSLVASSIYILNDIYDLPSDREHPEKKHRPLADGKISLTKTFVFSLFLISTSLTCSYFFNIKVFSVILFYIFLNYIYTRVAKKIQIIDVFFLCLFYIIRLFLGSQATDIILSYWLLGFASFLFLGLGIMKRYIEVSKYLPAKHTNKRTYTREDNLFLLVFGSISSFSSILILSLYISEFINNLSTNEHVFAWIMLIAFMYSMLRLWHKAFHKKIDSDPVKFILKDTSSLVTIIIIFGMFIISRTF